MQKTLLIKLSIIAGLCLVFAIGLSMLKSLVSEREHYASAVVQEIKNQHVQEQQVTTPFIIVPTVVNPACTTPPSSYCKPYTKFIPIFASQTEAKQTLQASQDMYKRGIYHVTSYQGNLLFNQQYQLNDIQKQLKTLLPKDSNPSLSSQTPPTANNNTKNDTQEKNQHQNNTQERIEPKWSEARLVVFVSDMRGVSELPKVKIDGKAVDASYGKDDFLSSHDYLEVPLPKAMSQQLEQGYDDSSTDKKLTVMTDLPILGMTSLRNIPLGQQFRLSMNSNWQTPKFTGQALPPEKHLSNQGFEARWQNQYLTIANNQKLQDCLGKKENRTCLLENGFEVNFAEPNDVYLQTERILKYALLLILVSFATFFLFEVIKSARIHPIQYLLVGSALLVFYVLLLSLAEQIIFWQAYMLSSLACVGLIGWYTYYVLGNLKRAGIFTVILSSLYASFYGILTTEDMNLLLGAMFCFILLGSVMFVTRKIDWYQVA